MLAWCRSHSHCIVRICLEERGWWFGKGSRDIVHALEGKVSASRMLRIDLRMLS